MIKKYYLFTALLLFILCIQSAVASQKRIALVIGNSNYKESPLKNPVNDATDMAAKLTSYGFEVEKLTNATKRKMKQAVNRFSRKLNQKDTVGLFFFAGHGLQVNNYNYLLPIDSEIDNEADVEYEAINASRILDQMALADNGLNLMILDACRNNPFSRSFRSSSRGLTLMRPASGSMILYATEPGKVAADGKGRNGLFTEKLLKNMGKKGAKVEEVFKQTAIAVKRSSRKKQIPWSEGIIFGDFYFNGKLTVNQPKITVASGDTDSASKYENNFWDSIKHSHSIEMYQAYLDEYPQGHFTRIAIIKLKQLNKQVKLETKSTPKALVTHAQLTIRSNVYNDMVTINGEEKGSSKLEVKVKSGIYTIDVSKEGYQSWEQNIKIMAGHNQSIYAKLKKKPQSKPVVSNYSRPTPKPAKKYNYNSSSRTITDSATGMKLVKIPSGCFQMGSNEYKNEKPKHRVCITQDFYLGKYEVTQGQWQAIMGTNPSKFQKGDNYPVEQVSWNDIQIFIKKINNKTGKNYRLPTEAEWEYACKSGGKDQKYCGGNSADSVSWHRGNSGNKTHKVGQKKSNGLGLYDMSGNVWEWVQDWYHKNYYQNSPTNNPTGVSGGYLRGDRGGSWNINARYVHSTARNKTFPKSLFDSLGFRLARNR